ncbi:MAG: type IV pilus assembly protein PilM [Patescibacteria group bacterium]
MEKTFFSKIFPKGVKFWARTQSVVGIDIGSTSVKMVQLRKEKEQAILETYGELAGGPYVGKAIGQISQLSEDVAVDMLKDLSKEASVNSKDAAVAIPIKNSFVTTIRIPLVKNKSIEEVIKFEARRYIPVPFAEVEIDWWVLHRDDEKDEKDEEQEIKGNPSPKVKFADVLLVAIHKEILNKYRTILSRAGFEVKLFEIEIFSAWRSSVGRQTTPVVIIDMGALSTKMSVIDEGVLRSSRTIDKGSQAITDLISKSLRIGFERAEEMKRQVGISSRPEYKELVSVMESVLNYIFSETKQFMIAYRKKYDSSVGKVVLAGGGALLQNVVEVAVRNLGVEVILADPFLKTSYPPFLQDTLRDIGPAFSVAAGLALRGL